MLCIYNGKTEKIKAVCLFYIYTFVFDLKFSRTKKISQQRTNKNQHHILILLVYSYRVLVVFVHKRRSNVL